MKTVSKAMLSAVVLCAALPLGRVTAQEAKPAMNASERAAARVAAAKRARYDRLVTGALRNADRLGRRAEALEIKAASAKPGARLSLVRSASRLARSAHRAIQRYRAVDVSPDVRAALDKALAARRLQTVGLYEQLINYYLSRGRIAIARKLAGELRSVDAALAKRAAAAVASSASLARAAAGPRDTGLRLGTRFNLRGAPRLTGAALRFAARRGFVPTAPRRGATVGRGATRAPRSTGGARSTGGRSGGRR